MTKKLVYNGPEGFSVQGAAELVPGEEVELSDEQAEQLAEHDWFDAPSGKSKKKEAAE